MSYFHKTFLCFLSTALLISSIAHTAEIDARPIRKTKSKTKSKPQEPEKRPIKKEVFDDAVSEEAPPKAKPQNRNVNRFKDDDSDNDDDKNSNQKIKPKKTVIGGSSFRSDGAWGTDGALTLGAKGDQAANFNLHFGPTDLFRCYGYFGIEGSYVLALASDLDLRVGLRVPFFQTGLIPELGVRYQVVGGGVFNLAIDASLSMPMTFFPAILIGTSISPGFLMSILPISNLELVLGLNFPTTLIFYGEASEAKGAGLTTNLGFDVKVGFAYNISPNVGLFFMTNLIPNYWFAAPGTKILFFDFHFKMGAQIKF